MIVVAPLTLKRVVSSDINETVDTGDQQPANKYQRFELESDDLGNSWALPSVEATYVHKYMAVHISPKDIKEKILSVTPVPSNIKNAENLMNTSKSY